MSICRNIISYKYPYNYTFLFDAFRRGTFNRAKKWRNSRLFFIHIRLHTEWRNVNEIGFRIPSGIPY